MSERAEGQDTGAEAAAGGVDPIAVAMALGGASRKRADSFFKDQQAPIAAVIVIFLLAVGGAIERRVRKSNAAG